MLESSQQQTIYERKGLDYIKVASRQGHLLFLLIIVL